VEHAERDVEFHDLTDMVREWWGPDGRECGPASCESIALDLGEHLADREVFVQSASVAIDSEGGAVTRWVTP
jgi:hypothetical protein